MNIRLGGGSGFRSRGCPLVGVLAGIVMGSIALWMLVSGVTFTKHPDPYFEQNFSPTVDGQDHAVGTQQLTVGDTVEVLFIASGVTHTERDSDGDRRTVTTEPTDTGRGGGAFEVRITVTDPNGTIVSSKSASGFSSSWNGGGHSTVYRSDIFTANATGTYSVEVETIQGGHLSNWNTAIGLSDEEYEDRAQAVWLAIGLCCCSGVITVLSIVGTLFWFMRMGGGAVGPGF